MPRQRQTDDTTLLELATMQFLRDGYAGTSVRDLEQCLGIKAPALYHRFGSKEELFARAFEFYLQRFVDQRINQYLYNEQPLVGLRNFFDTAFSDDREPPYVCLMVSTAIDADTNTPPCMKLVHEGNKRLQRGFSDNINRAKNLGLIDSSANTSQLVDYLMLCLQGLLVARRLEPAKTLHKKVASLFSVLPITKTKE